MNLAHLVSREIRHRKLNFLLSLLGAAAAVLSVVIAVCLLTAHDRHSERLIQDMAARMKTDMAKLEDDIRKSMKGLGFNVYIFPKDQDLSEVYAEGYASKTMPEEYVTKLSESEIVVINHLLPSLTRKLKWEEQQRTIILIGIRGEVPQAHRDPKAPLIEPVEKGKLVLGYELHKSLGLKAGDAVTLQGRSFTVAKTHPERGTTDDITVWMNLEECQDMLDLKGRINAILALECNCATVDRIGEIRQELSQILPDTQVVETNSTAVARAESRNLAKATAEAQITAKERERQVLHQERERFTATLLPMVTVFGMVWVGMLALINVRERVTEIGILRAVGVKSGLVFSAFLSRSFLAGLAGAVLALAGFTLSFPVIRERLFQGEPLTALMSAATWALPLLLTPALAAAAAWLPAVWAARKDPADILRHD